MSKGTVQDNGKIRNEIENDIEVEVEGVEKVLNRKETMKSKKRRPGKDKRERDGAGGTGDAANDARPDSRRYAGADRVPKLIEGIRAGERRALARGITLIESTHPEDSADAREILRELLPETGKSLRIGITGVPGVGKSTFIEAFGLYLIGQGHRLAVLAVDPSSPFSGGSILGDKTRMEKLARHDNAYIRPSPTGGNLGGVSRKTREAILLCEASGYDIVLVETVGVGQSEFEVASMTDLFMVMLLPNAGDALQGIKRGILELADLLVVNKADGDTLKMAAHARNEFEQALHMVAPKYPGLNAPVLQCSSLQQTGLDEIWKSLNERTGDLKKRSLFAKNRKHQMVNWARRLADEELLRRFWTDDSTKKLFSALTAKLIAGQITPSEAVEQLLER
jgi:LAO/AO transport system kinase